MQILCLRWSGKNIGLHRVEQAREHPDGPLAMQDLHSFSIYGRVMVLC
jgi:hypothetical protein